MKNILLMAVALFMLGTSLISRAGGGTANEFVGLWEAVDPEDGSHLMLSITNNNDGTVKLLVYDTFWSRCNGSSRGIAQGTGEISAEQSLKVDDYTVTCFETGDTVKVAITLTRNSDGTLSRTGAAPLVPLIIYHQTSK
ncbi:hypothetical protein [Methylobacter sp. YRD-M1]|uniref:hypothetical protein n=1 Tax=Methylobacter sp. YRD-M1 TaxID=2911520 RepID=UPI00227D6138|nr:hypothetical protein [Methylobacter sp. YRD-M1]WAK00929.1 hypothetical protein LZ558_13910 [Methylobacter sp. YRD-M1]